MYEVSCLCLRVCYSRSTAVVPHFVYEFNTIVKLYSFSDDDVSCVRINVLLLRNGLQQQQTPSLKKRSQYLLLVHIELFRAKGLKVKVNFRLSRCKGEG